MKKLLIPLLMVVALLGAGLWLLVRRGPAVAPPDDSPALLHAESTAGGILYRHPEGQTPLRALRWLPPFPGGYQVVQIVSQNDRQRVVIFQDERQVMDAVIPRPQSVREGFFHFAELAEAIVTSDLAVLLYRSSSGATEELPLMVGLDLVSGGVRWMHRGAGERLALTPEGKDRAVILFGSASPILRLPLELRTGERTGDSLVRKAATIVELPEEIKAVGDLLATGPTSLLVAHANGLSHHSSKGWKHWPLPEKGQPSFAETRPVLAEAKGYWWQPFPGKLVKLKSDGEPAAETPMPEPVEPWKQDRALLRLIGGDAAGHLWFALATPMVSSPVATPEAVKPVEPPSQDGAAPTQAPATPEVAKAAESAADLPAYLAGGLERLYRWNPERRALQMVELPKAWAAISLPNVLNKPPTAPAPSLPAGAMLVDSGSAAWRCPLDRLLSSGN